MELLGALIEPIEPWMLENYLGKRIKRNYGFALEYVRFLLVNLKLS
jgi:hypothetical protein